MNAATWDTIVEMKTIRLQALELYELKLEGALEKKDYRAIAEYAAKVSKYANMIAELDMLENELTRREQNE
jgi:hypothetical protein